MNKGNHPQIIVTGFRPFHKFEVNSSEIVARALQCHPEVEKFVCHVEILAVEYDRCFDQLDSLLDNFDHDAVISFGLASSSSVIRLEQIARNRDYSGAPDMAGVSREARTIIEGAPASVSSTLPLKEIAEQLERRRFPWCYSDDAGGYVCNNLFFHIMNDDEEKDRQRGLIHIPPVGEEPWTEARLVAASAVIVKTVADKLKAKDTKQKHRWGIPY